MVRPRPCAPPVTTKSLPATLKSPKCFRQMFSSLHGFWNDFGCSRGSGLVFLSGHVWAWALRDEWIPRAVVSRIGGCAVVVVVSRRRAKKRCRDAERRALVVVFIVTKSLERE